MGRTHAPSQARGIVAAWKQGQPVNRLVQQARGIDDPYHASWALFQLSDAKPKLAGEAMELFDQVEPDWRRAELAAQVAPRLPPETVLLLARRLLQLPPGKARSQALPPVVKRVPPEHLAELLAQAAQDPEGVEDAKTILREWAQNPEADMEPVLEQIEPETRARLYGYLHLQDEKTRKPLLPDAFGKALQAAEQAPERSGVLRYLATVARTRDELEAVVEQADDEAEPRLRLLLKTIAQGDRIGEKDLAQSHLEQARRALARVDDPVRRERLERNLQKADDLLHGRKSPGKSGDKNTGPPSRVPARKQLTLPDARAPRPVIALHNGYTGNLGPPHLRAVGRAAPLCAAFGLDLLLVGFPADDAASLVAQAERDTRIGEGADYARALLEAGRVHWAPPEHHTQPERWPTSAPVVATTPHPHPKKAIRLDDLPADVVLVVGLGPQGLPKALLNKAPHHLELTGHGVSLETATAMGVIAHALGRRKR